MLLLPLIIHKLIDKSNILMQLLLLSLLNIVIQRKSTRISIFLLLSKLIIPVSIPPLKSLLTSSHLLALPKVPSIHPPPLLICPLFIFLIHTFDVFVSFLHRRHGTILFVISLTERRYNKSRRGLSCRIGDLIYVEVHTGCSSLGARRFDPYTVIQTSGQQYYLVTHDLAGQADWCHISQLYLTIKRHLHLFSLVLIINKFCPSSLLLFSFSSLFFFLFFAFY